MNKKITAILVSLITLTSAQIGHTAENNQPATLAIIDTAIDSTIPEIKNALVQEVCILDWNTCPNGKNFMEGPGSATLPVSILSKNNLAHGTQMANSAIKANPNIKIVFIRYVGVTSTGSKQITNESSFYNPLIWIYNNKDKYNIQAVSMSQGHHNLGKTADYCPKTPNTENAIKNLLSVGIPTFYAAGNDRDYKRIDWPSCISATISVGATGAGDSIAPYSNADQALLDFYANGSTRVKTAGGTEVNIAGTSVSTQVLAASWVGLKNKNTAYSYNDIYSIIKSKAVPTAGRGTSGLFVDSWSLLNG